VILNVSANKIIKNGEQIHSNYVYAISVIHDKNLIVTTSSDKTLVFSDFNLNKIKVICENCILHHQLQLNNNTLAVTSESGLKLYDLDKMERLNENTDAKNLSPIVMLNNKIYIGDCKYYHLITMS
jgi:WD40 repeat protein